MKGKGLIKFFAIALAIICLAELFPTFYVYRVESKANQLSDGSEKSIKSELDKLSKDTLNLGLAKFSYQDLKKHEIKLGLDLKGGLNLLLEISQKDLIIDLADNSKNEVFLNSISATDNEALNSAIPYTQLFFKNFKLQREKSNQKDIKLSSEQIFGTKALSGQIKYNTTDREVEDYISKTIESRINSSIDVIRTRIKKLNIDEPNIARVPGSGRILVELPGILDAERVKKLLQTSARLEFWELNDLPLVYSYFELVNQKQNNQLFQILKPSNRSYAVGLVNAKDTTIINNLLSSQQAKALRPISLKYTKFFWSAKPAADSNNEFELYAIKGNKKDRAPLVGAVTDASLIFDQFNRIQISMQMDNESAVIWKDLTEKNLGKPLAVVLDNSVYTAPNVSSVIANGQSVISGNYGPKEAGDLVDVLKSGRLPTKAKIIQSEIVGPTLGSQSIQNGLISIVASYIFILVWMIFYYGRAGMFANLALLINLFYLIGIMASSGAVLTLPGIAGIVLSMAMAVDANIIIFERVKEELRRGKPIKQAFFEGQKHAFNAIIDGNLTTLIVGGVLMFSTGPIKGFAITLVIGIFCTLFTSIFLTSLFIVAQIQKGKIIKIASNISKNWFTKVQLKWMEKRKIAYIFSTILTIISLLSIFTKGFDKGVDYTGGRTYVVKLNREVPTDKLASILQENFSEQDYRTSFDVKRYGGNNQVRITTKYQIHSTDPDIENKIRVKLFNSFKEFLPKNFDLNQFESGKTLGIQSSSEVGPTVASGIVKNGVIAVSIALAGIFLYILIRFRNWQMSAGAVISLFHDSIIVMGAFSLLSWVKIMPFSVEIDQSFIAAVLTIIGYSINDTVIVFDRIRENKKSKLIHSMSLKELYNDAINHTLGRTLNTGISTIIVTIIIFLFGGETLRGFMFALFLGFTFGIYSSIYISSAISFDLTKWMIKKN